MLVRYCEGADANCLLEDKLVRSHRVLKLPCNCVLAKKLSLFNTSSRHDLVEVRKMSSRQRCLGNCARFGRRAYGNKIRTHKFLMQGDCYFTVPWRTKVQYMQCLILVFRYYTYHDKRTMNYYSTNKEETISFLRLCLKKNL